MIKTLEAWTLKFDWKIWRNVPLFIGCCSKRKKDNKVKERRKQEKEKKKQKRKKRIITKKGKKQSIAHIRKKRKRKGKIFCVWKKKGKNFFLNYQEKEFLLENMEKEDKKIKFEAPMASEIQKKEKMHLMLN